MGFAGLNSQMYAQQVLAYYTSCSRAWVDSPRLGLGIGFQSKDPAPSTVFSKVRCHQPP